MRTWRCRAVHARWSVRSGSESLSALRLLCSPDLSRFISLEWSLRPFLPPLPPLGPSSICRARPDIIVLSAGFGGVKLLCRLAGEACP